MKFLKNKAVLLAAAFVIAGSLGINSVAYQFGGGSRNIDPQRHQQLLWVYNSDDVAHEDGDVVVWYDGSTVDGLEVSTTTTANNGLVAGVCYGTLAATSWGWVQTHGYHDSVTIGVANSAGDMLVTSTTGEAAGVYSLAQATGALANQAAISGDFAVALEATTSSTTVKAFILR